MYGRVKVQMNCINEYKLHETAVSNLIFVLQQYNYVLDSYCYNYDTECFESCTNICPQQ